MTGRAGGTGPGPRDKFPPGPRPSTPAPGPQPAPQTPAPTETATPAGGCSGARPDGPLRRVVRIRNPLGLHPRLADRLLRTAKQYTCTVTLWNGEKKADGTNIFDMILLVVEAGSEVVLEVDGPDAAKAVDTLAEVLGSPGGEDYTI